MKRFSKISNVTGNKGSVLFIVVVIMSLLIALAGALFFSLSAEYDNLYEETRTEQAYQSALAVSDWVYDYLKAYVDSSGAADFTKLLNETNFTATENPLLAAMLKMTTAGETIETDYTPMSDRAGDYKITVKLAEKNTNANKPTLTANEAEYVFHVISEVRCEAETASFTRVLTVVSEKGSGNGGTNGNLNNQSLNTAYTSDGVIVASDGTNCAGNLTIDGLPAKGGADNSGYQLNVKENLLITSSGGNNINDEMFDKGATIRVGGDLIISSKTGDLSLFAGSSINSRTYIYVLGDMKVTNSNFQIRYCDIYVVGSLDISVVQPVIDDSNIYVAGNVNINSINGLIRTTNVYAGGTITRTGIGGGGFYKSGAGDVFPQSQRDQVKTVLDGIDALFGGAGSSIDIVSSYYI